MARKQFVSSKKNAPSRAVSSKEAALHGRDGASTVVDENNGDELSPPSSPASSNSSSSPSSGNESESEFQQDIPDSGGNAVAVEVMPSSGGRGKQLRFPMGMTRGKESRIAHDGAQDEGENDSDDLLSIDSGEGGDGEERHHVSESDGDHPPIASPGLDSSPEVAPNAPLSDSPYPIKGHRARKRHRPDSKYFKQMATYVRDCLLTVRGDAEAAELFDEEHHREFRRKLEKCEVDRVIWRDSSPDCSSQRPKKEAKKEKKKEKTSKKEKRREGQGMTEQQQAAASKDRLSDSESQAKRSKARKSKDSSPSSAVEPSARDNSLLEKDTTQHRSQHFANAKEVRPSSSKCSRCQRIDDGALLLEEKGTQASLAEPPEPKAGISRQEEPIPAGSITIPVGGGKDIERMRADAAKLNEEARALKHEGNHKGASDQGKFYLRSGAKFFQHALKLADIKAAYKEIGDTHHARSFGDYCVTTLKQTTSLIESTIRSSQSAGNKKLVAIGCKLASLVHLTIYRLQHLKLFSLYSDLFTPGRSPDSRQNGTTPPLAAGSADNKEAAIRTLLLKEMEHTLRGFEMWRRYEACRVEVLRRITNPATADLKILFEDLDAELNG